MQCSECGYMMTAFDKSCPRCKEMQAKGIVPKPSINITPSKTEDRLRPELANAHLPVQARKPDRPLLAPQEAPTPRPLRVVSEAMPVAAEPAPLVIYTNRPVLWKPYAAAVLVLALFLGGFLAWKHSQDVLTQSMVTAARAGACERMPGFDTDREQRACQQLSSALTYTVNPDGDSRATVIFYLAGATSSLAVAINRDNQGEWHAVSAKEGDEGNRQAYDRTVVPVWKHQEAPPAPDIGGPTAPNPDSSSIPASPPDTSGYPATSTGEGTPSVPTRSYSITTKAGGGTPPDTSQFKSGNF